MRPFEISKKANISAPFKESNANRENTISKSERRMKKKSLELREADKLHMPLKRIKAKTG